MLPVKQHEINGTNCAWVDAIFHKIISMYFRWTFAGGLVLRLFVLNFKGYRGRGWIILFNISCIVEQMVKIFLIHSYTNRRINNQKVVITRTISNNPRAGKGHCLCFFLLPNILLYHVFFVSFPFIHRNKAPPLSLLLCTEFDARVWSVSISGFGHWGNANEVKWMLLLFFRVH